LGKSFIASQLSALQDSGLRLAIKSRYLLAGDQKSTSVNCPDPVADIVLFSNFNTGFVISADAFNLASAKWQHFDAGKVLSTKQMT